MEIQQIISQDKKEEQREKQFKKDHMAKEKAFIDDQVSLEQNRRIELQKQIREAEQKIILKVKGELENEKTRKLMQKQQQKKEYQRMLEENNAARQKAIQKKQEEKEYDTH